MTSASLNSIEERPRGQIRTRPKHLMHVFPSFAVGGAQVRFGQLAAAHGGLYRHTVLALDGNLGMAPILSSAIAIECVIPDYNKKAGFRNLPLFRRTIAQYRPDILVTYNWGAMEWCLANRFHPLARHIHIEDGFGPEERHKQLARRVWLRRIALSGHQTQVVLPSRVLERIALADWRLPPRSAFYIPNGVDCARFAPAAHARRGRLNDPARTQTLVVGTIATLRPEKNLAHLIRMFAAVAEARPSAALKLMIVGDGPERAFLEAEARSSGRAEQIIFTGQTSTPENALAEMDVFVLSSVTEQMPLSVLEAMAAELPIVSFAVGDVADMVAPESKPYVVHSDDESGFRKNLEVLCADSDLRTRLGRANRAEALARFDHKLMIARYAQLFG